MSTLTKEKSIQESKPYELLRFVFGPNPEDVAAYTTEQSPVSYNAETYQPLPMDREAITVSQSLDNAVLAVTLPHDSVIAKQYQLYPPVVPVTVAIFRGQRGEETPLPIWVGRVIWADFQEDLSIRLECEPITTGFKRVGLHLHYQHVCPHVLYDSKTCKASKEANTITRQVVSLAGNEVTIPGHYDDSFRLVSGVIEWGPGTNNNKRTIYRATPVVTPAGNDATVLTLLGTVESFLTTEDDLTIRRGCARTITECSSVFNNAINFGGFPFIPTENPTQTSRVFY